MCHNVRRSRGPAGIVNMQRAASRTVLQSIGDWLLDGLWVCGLPSHNRRAREAGTAVNRDNVRNQRFSETKKKSGRPGSRTPSSVATDTDYCPSMITQDAL